MKKTVFITGASGNLGKATVEVFLQKGYTVLATVSPGKKLSFTPSRPVDTYECDLTDEQAAKDVVTRAILNHQQIDAALLLAGGFAAGEIAAADGTSLRQMFSLNFETAYYIARPIFLQMQKQTGGRIVLVGARPALKAMDGKNLVSYGLSKSLLFKLAEYLNAEGQQQNIVTSVIVPSTIDTSANRAAMPNADFSRWVAPEKIANLMAYICSDEASALREPIYRIYGQA